MKYSLNIFAFIYLCGCTLLTPLDEKKIEEVYLKTKTEGNSTASDKQRMIREEHEVYSKFLFQEDLFWDAFAASPKIKESLRTLSSENSKLKASRWQRFPTLEAETSYINDSQSKTSYNLTVNAPISTGGRISGNIKQASAKRDRARASCEEIYLTTAIDAAHTSLEVVRWRLKASIAEKNIQKLINISEVISRRIHQGVGTEADLDFAKSRRLQAELSYKQNLSREAMELNSLRILVGDEFFSPKVLPSFPDDWPILNESEILGQMISFSPRIRMSSFDVIASAAEVQIEKSDALPNLNARYIKNERSSTYGIFLNTKLSGGLASLSNVRAAQERVAAARMHFDASIQEFKEEMNGLLTLYKSNIEEIKANKRILLSSEQILSSYERQITNGSKNWLDVLNASREVMTAETLLIDAQIDSQKILVQLIILSGNAGVVNKAMGECKI